MKASTRFVTPSLTKTIENEWFDLVQIIDDRAYRRKISGYNKTRWYLILKCGISKEEVDNFTLDELMEAYYAWVTFQEEEKRAQDAQ